MVLDIGYGSGSWLMEMNKEFPDAKYVGVDISGAIPDYRAYNVTYEFGNIVKGLKYPDQSFDFINVRLLIYSLSVDEWHIALKEIRRLLKPEGCVQFMECQNVSTEPKDRSDYENAIFEAATEVGQDPMILHNFEKYAKNCEMRVIQKDQRHIFFGEKHSRMDLFSRMWQLTHEAFLTNVGPRLGISVSEYKSYAERYIKWQTETNAEFIWCGFLVRKK
ncbi:S-adenosyl-L-methionine-dependent methyltransferase [Spinellus fusiger]|nr:S-adenosyl-L-methionine-dependent methyltransferase [Spinellus fusiger]